ncbi:hypothetical protein DIE11_17350 [Burkholderia sp. Bp9012]|nr:hypothetical protein DIE11_17350 [Burkholderia sp. Bp9012]
MIAATFAVTALHACMCFAADRALTTKEAEAQVQAMSRDTTGALNTDQTQALRVAMGGTDLLEAPRLAPATIIAVGDLIVRAGADPGFQDEFLDNWGGLWSRVGIDVDPIGYALLEDRVALSAGKPTLNGTILGTHQSPSALDELRYRSRLNRLGIGGKTSADIRAWIAGHHPSLTLVHPSYPTDPTLRKELIRLGRLDQSVRAAPDHELSKAEQAEEARKLEGVDAQTLPAMQRIYARYGFPAPQRVGRSAVQAAWLIIQHAVQDPPLMRRAADDARKMVARDELPMIDYALLVDRIACVLDKKPQQYGTQGSRDPKSFWYCPIDQPDQVNARRAALFLQPLSHDDIYGADVVGGRPEVEQ